MANNPAFTHHLTVLLRLLSAITDTRLHKVVYDFNTKYTSNKERTVKRLVAVMHIGEAALPLNEQSCHQVSTVTTSDKTNGTSGVQKFCTFHSFGGNASTHSTADCKTINKGLTKNDPTSSQWQVMKDTGEHYSARQKEIGKVEDRKAWELATDDEIDAIIASGAKALSLSSHSG